MSLTLTADFNLNCSIVETLTLGLATGGRVTTPLAVDFPFTSGTGANKGNEYYSISGAGAANTPDNYTLSALTDAVGRSIAFAKIRGMAIYIPTGTDGQDLVVRWPTVAAPVSAPTCNATGSDGTLNGTYLVSYAWRNANGITTRSPDATVVASSTNHIAVTLPALPTGATGADVYCSTAGGISSTETKQNLVSITGTSFSILGLLAGEPFKTANTCYYNGWLGVPPAGVTVRAGGMLVMVAPMVSANAVTATTGDKLTIDPGANTIPYSLLVFGE